MLQAAPGGLPDNNGLPCANPDALSDPDRVPLAGQEVSFYLSSDLADIELSTNSGQVDASGRAVGTTDANGLVTVEVRSGFISTQTYVVAEFEAQTSSGVTRTLSTTSNQIVVSTGLPDQNSITLGTDVFNVPRARDVNGERVTLTVSMADKFNNPVADGTAAVFTTEYGAIDGSCLTGVANGARLGGVPERGTCSVLWTSQSPRFPLFNSDRIKTIDGPGYSCSVHNGNSGPCPADLGAIRGLRSTVLVTALGEENFVDSNGNGLYDDGEPFVNLPEAFLDLNEDGVYTPTEGPQCPSPSSSADCDAAGSEEEFLDINRDGVYSTNVDPGTGTGVYNGSLCSVEDDGVFCSRDLVHVRDSLVLTLSSTVEGLTAIAARTSTTPRNVSSTLVEGFTYEIYVADLYNNVPGLGTELTFTPSGDCALVFPEAVAPDTDSQAIAVGQITRPGAFTTSIAVNGTGDTSGGAVLLTATDTDTGVSASIASFSCSTTCDELVDDDNDPNTADVCVEEL